MILQLAIECLLSFRRRVGGGSVQRIVCLSILILIEAVADPVWAQPERPTISIELNRLEDKGMSCRLSFVFTNRLPDTVEILSFETVLFDTNGSVERLLVLKSKPLSPGKIRVQQFDVQALKCASVGRVLLNDIKKCKAGDVNAAACLQHVSPSSRAGIPFVSTVPTRGKN